MEFGKALLRQMGILPKSRLIDRLSAEELKELSIEAAKKKADILMDLLTQYRTIKREDIKSIIELGSFVYDKERVRSLYKKLNSDQFNSLEFDIPKEFIPTADYFGVYYLKMTTGRECIFIFIERSDYIVEPKIEDLFEIKEENLFDLEIYPNRFVYYEEKS